MNHGAPKANLNGARSNDLAIPYRTLHRVKIWEGPWVSCVPKLKGCLAQRLGATLSLWVPWSCPSATIWAASKRKMAKGEVKVSTSLKGTIKATHTLLSMVRRGDSSSRSCWIQEHPTQSLSIEETSCQVQELPKASRTAGRIRAVSTGTERRRSLSPGAHQAQESTLGRSGANLSRRYREERLPPAPCIQHCPDSPPGSGVTSRWLSL